MSHYIIIHHIPFSYCLQRSGVTTTLRCTFICLIDLCVCFCLRFLFRSLKSLTSSPLAVAPTIRSSSPHPSKSVTKNDSSEKPEKPEKEKKKKEFNSSRQKKFSRHFIQVEDEKVLNCELNNYKMFQNTGATFNAFFCWKIIAICIF